MGEKKDVKKKTSIFDDEEIEELEVKPKHKEEKADKEEKKAKSEEKSLKDEVKESKKDDKVEKSKKEDEVKDSKKESKKDDKDDKEEKTKKESEKETSKKEEKKDLDKKKSAVAAKTSTKSKKDDDDDLLEDEESESLGIKVVMGIVIIAIIIILLLKSCGGETVKYDVEFDTNGGTEVSALEIEEDGTIPKPEDPTKEGYVFVGWYYNDELYDFSKPVTGDITLEARWAEEEAVAVSGVELDQTTLKLSPGGKAALVATVSPENAKDKSLTWSSSNEAIVTVDENGNVTAVKEGTATITVTTADGGYTAKATVTVSADVVAVTGVSLDKTTLSLAPNESSTLKATVTPTKASNKGVTWTSSDNTVATVSSTGKVTAKKDGTATITVTTKDGGFTATCTVTVKTVKATGVKVNKTSVTVKEGKTITVTATVAPTNATNKNVTWTTADASIAKVSQTGVITGVKEGTTTITVTTKDGGHTATVNVTVTAPVAVDGVTISGPKEVEQGKAITLQANITPATADDKTVSWTSSDKSIATVTSAGKVTGVNPGKVTITATTKNGKTATYEVTVKEKPASYTITFSANYTGTQISGWSFTAYKNKVAFTGYGMVKCGKTQFHRSSGQAPGNAEQTRECEITLSSGEKVKAAATWVD